MTDKLTPDMKGRWLVTSQGSQHVWDLDKMTYQRLRGENRARFDADGEVVKITRVSVWPAVGHFSFLWFDDPEFPNDAEQWRQSSTIRSIEPLEEK